MRISAKVDYAVRAALELAAAGGDPIKGEAIADAQDIPLKFLENILGELKHTGIVSSRRGAQGGYWPYELAPGSLRGVAELAEKISEHREHIEAASTET